MEHTELKIFITMKKDVKSSVMYEILNKFINKGLLNDKRLSLAHKKNCFKFYTFGLPYKIEKDGIYKKDKMYAFNIRSVSVEFILALARCIENGCEYFLVEGKSVNSYTYKKINKLISLTPTVVTLENGHYWCEADGVEVLKNKLNSNIERKLKAYFDDFKIEKGFNFIKDIEVKNKRLIMIPYKSAMLFGNKLEILVEENEMAQTMATMALAVGLGEKGSVGCGYCMVAKDKQ